ncbi:RHS repeat domain-containing protein, partial [Longitalea luteola]|uniref:RHS repeat domain-containing protein n=1 Tax=Longitalea luteola TaxID=2812563 RepID=UPI00272DEFE6
ADFNQWVSGSGATAIFNKSANIDFSVTGITYDANGNLLTMNQNGLKGSTSPLIDQLTYNYQNNSNKLSHVADAASDPNTTLGDFRDGSNGAGADYSYDVNGNLIQDNNKAISNITYNYLNLPSVVTVAGKGTITYTYDAAGIKLKKEIAENGQPLKTILYTGGAVYENDKLQFMMHEEGRIRPLKDASDNITGFTFDYFLKDHLGNVRMVLTEEQTTNMYPAATMETASSDVEEALYSNVNNTIRSNKPAGYPDDTSANPNEKVARLRGDGKKIGPAMVLKVMAGDKFNVRANSWYRLNGATPGKPVSPLNDLVMALTASIGGGPGGKIAGQQVNPGKMFNIGALEFLKDQRYNSSRPKAYLNWILFDDQLKYVSGGVDQVGNDQELKKHQLSGVQINKSGFLYIYVSNETPNIDVFFDNLQVTHIPGPVLEETHYYPFGLTMAGISSKALNGGGNDNNCGCPNKVGFNGNEIQTKEFSDGSGLEVYDFNARTYDQQIGRFVQIDPKVEEAGQDALTPYQFGLNNPILYNDPNGECPICPLVPFIIKAFIAGAAVDAGTQVVTNKIQGQSWSESFKNVDLRQSAVSGGFSVLSAGSSNFVGGTKAATTITKAFVQTGLEAGESAANQYLQNGTIDTKQMFSDVLMDKTAGVLTKNVNANTIRGAENQLDRARRVAAGDPTSGPRQQKLIDAGNNLTTQQTINNTASAITGSALQEISNGVRSSNGNSNSIKSLQLPDLQKLMTPVIDNTRVVTPYFPNRYK